MVKKLEYLNEPQLRKMMNAMGDALKVVAEAYDVESPHFVLLLFNTPKLGQYCSNCSRDDMIKALKETAWRLENKEDIPR